MNEVFVLQFPTHLPNAKPPPFSFLPFEPGGRNPDLQTGMFVFLSGLPFYFSLTFSLSLSLSVGARAGIYLHSLRIDFHLLEQYLVKEIDGEEDRAQI